MPLDLVGKGVDVVSPLELVGKGIDVVSRLDYTTLLSDSPMVCRGSQ